MNSHKIKSIYLFFILSFIGFSQGDQRARALLDQVSEVYASYDTMQMRFSYQLDNTAEAISQKEEGGILVAKDKYRLTILGIQQIFDGTFVYTIDDLNEEVIIQEQTALDTPLNPLNIFDFHKEGYLLQWDIAQRVSGRDIRYIKLIPTETESESKYLLLGIDTSSKELYKIIDLGINGTDTTFVIKQFTANQPLAPETFVFDKDKYANYYIERY
ncbi:MAG: outer membrane lipoprotein carrier protein LolA [Bacteroidota bacterium]|nr:outer membrane lipoprotein carrier protein LolA [Bacteroidota bacterium]